MCLRFSKLLNKISNLEKRILNLSSVVSYGRIVSINGFVLEAIGLNARIGTQCFIERIVNGKNKNIFAEIVGFKKDSVFLISYEQVSGISYGSRIFLCKDNHGNILKNQVPLGMELLGRVLNGRGQPLDDFPVLNKNICTEIYNKTINPLHRKPITKILDTGIRAINGLLTIGKGQRIGIFSCSGIGKSILLGMMAKYTQADVVVIALIGERGREVKFFIDNILGPKGLKRSVVIAAPASMSPLLKIQAALYASHIAEYFCKKNKNVLLIMDSLTRYAMAEREIALSLGEIPVNKGYSSSIFSKIPNLIESTGNISNDIGSITSFYTVLVENEEDDYDPVSYLARSILDGHIILSRKYANSGHYPAIDIESSVSRVMPEIISAEQYSTACYFKKLVSSYQKNKELINIGAYVAGTDSVLDHAISIWPKLEAFLQQNQSEKINYLTSFKELNDIFS